jgi:hypothetical protein
MRRLAPWVFALAGSLALTEFARAWFTRAAVSLHTGVVFALLALAWYAIVRTPRRRRAVTLGVTTAAAALAVVLLACAANAVVLSKQDPAQKAAAIASTDPGALASAGADAIRG